MKYFNDVEFDICKVKHLQLWIKACDLWKLTFDCVVLCGIKTLKFRRWGIFATYNIIEFDPAILLVYNFVKQISAGLFWKSRFNFYACVIPLFLSLVLLYFWIVVCVHFKDVRRGSKIGPSLQSQFEPPEDADDETGIRSRSRTEIESFETNNDRRYLYATSYDTADGMSPLPEFQASPTVSISSDIRSIKWSNYIT